MDEIVIKTHDFEAAKQELKEFSEQQTSDYSLRKVNSSKDVGEWFGEWIKGGGIGTDHKVTGSELNSLTTQIQKYLIEINSAHAKFIGEFGQVYNALEALDKDYIQAILISIKATEKTSERIAATQEQIQKIVEGQKKTLEILKKFKQKVESYAHLQDIDQMWNIVQNLRDTSGSLTRNVNTALTNSKENRVSISETIRYQKTLDKRLENIESNLKSLTSRLNNMLSFIDSLEELSHLTDVDKMWEDMMNTCNSIRSLSGDLKSVKKQLDAQYDETKKFFAFMASLSELEHLKDVDKIWETVSSHSNELNDAIELNHENSDAIKNQQKHIDKLEENNQRLTSIMHIYDVDKLWESNEETSRQLIASSESIKVQQVQIRELQGYKEGLQSVVHLYDVDKLWKTNEENVNQLAEVSKSINTHQLQINDFEDYRKKLDTISHLYDVDELWKSNDDIAQQLALTKTQMAEEIASTKEHSISAEASVAELQKKTDSTIDKLTRNIKVAYWIAGGSLGIALIEMLIIFMKVL